MAIIIKIEDSKVFIGMDDKTIKEVYLDECNFSPSVGMIVDVFESNGKTVVFPAATNRANTGSFGAGNNMGIVYTEADGLVTDKIAYVLFAMLLGSFGAHKFYVGKMGMGILYLLFFWTGIPGIIGLIEGILAITKPADMNGKIIIE